MKTAECSERPAIEHISVEMILCAAEPIVHQRESIGNQGIPMTRSTRMPDGGYEDIPIVTADTMRHGLRDAVSRALLDAADMGQDSLTEAALRLLFNGGNITGSAGGSVRMGDYFRMCELAPHLGLLGGCAQNRAIPSRVEVGDAMLMCAETIDPRLHLIPPHVREWATENCGTFSSYRGAMEEEIRVRHDATIDPTLRDYLLPDHRENALGRLIANEAASGDVIEQAKVKSGMMPRSHVAVKAGELFFWYIDAKVRTPIERETFWVMLATFLSRAKVGGKKAQGRGLLRPVRAWQVDIARPAARTDSIDVGGIGSRVGDLFRAHARERRDDLREFLRTVAA